MNTPEISIIITSYNKPELLKKSIESVLNQTMSSWELWIMDDNSNQQTVDVIKSFLKDKRINYFNSDVKDQERYKTTRYATLINKAITLSKGNYLTYLTDDTIYMSNRLEKMVQFLHKQPFSPQIIYGGQILKTVNHQFQVLYENKFEATAVLDKASDIVDHCSVLHTRNIAEKVYSKYGSYWNDSPDYWHNADGEFWRRLNEFESFYPIEGIYEIAYKTPNSFQLLNCYLPDPIPDGILISGLDNKIYITENGGKRFIETSWLSYFNIDNSRVVKIPDPILFKYKEGLPVSESYPPTQCLVKENKKEDYYFIERNKKRKLANLTALEKYNFNPSKAITLQSGTIDSLPNGLPIESNIKQDCKLPDGTLFSYMEGLYLSQKNTLHSIDINVALKLKLILRNSIKLTSEEFSYFNLGSPLLWKVKTF